MYQRPSNSWSVILFVSNGYWLLVSIHLDDIISTIKFLRQVVI
jgi:hypothetical protein